MFFNFYEFKVWKFKTTGLQILSFFLYFIGTPFGALMLWFGGYFILAGFSWLVVFCLAIMASVYIAFPVSFFMFWVALFNSDLWVSIGNIWGWIWKGWFKSSHLFLWPHVVKTFLPYMISGIVFTLLYYFAEKAKDQAQDINHINN